MRLNRAWRLKHALIALDDIKEMFEDCTVVYGDEAPETIDVYRSSLVENERRLKEAMTLVRSVMLTLDEEEKADA